MSYIILLIGIAGCGKRTIGRALEKSRGYTLIYNHTFSNIILNLVHLDPQETFIPDPVRHKINDILQVILSTIRELSPADKSFIFTSEMLAGTEKAEMLYTSLLETAKASGRIFVPIRLLCSEEELIRRIQDPAREGHFKTTNPKRASKIFNDYQLYTTGHKNEITIEVTNMQPDAVAQKIIDHLDSSVVID